MSLDTLANLKTRLGVSGSGDDTLLSSLMDSADTWIANFTGRDFVGGTFTEYFAGNSELLILANFPVSSVTSVKVDPAGAFGSDTVLASTTYAVHSERGVIQSKAGPFLAEGSPKAVQVVYATATSAVPNDVKQAYADLIGNWYRHVKTQIATSFQDVGQQQFGDASVSYRETIPTEVERLLAPYRTPNL